MPRASAESAILPDWHLDFRILSSAFHRFPSRTADWAGSIGHAAEESRCRRRKPAAGRELAMAITRESVPHAARSNRQLRRLHLVVSS